MFYQSNLGANNFQREQSRVKAQRLHCTASGILRFLVVAVVSRFVFDFILDTHLSHQVDAFVALSWTSVAKQLSSRYFHGKSQDFSNCICSITDLQW